MLRKVQDTKITLEGSVELEGSQLGLKPYPLGGCYPIYSNHGYVKLLGVN